MARPGGCRNTTSPPFSPLPKPNQWRLQDGSGHRSSIPTEKESGTRAVRGKQDESWPHPPSGLWSCALSRGTVGGGTLGDLWGGAGSGAGDELEGGVDSFGIRQGLGLRRRVGLGGICESGPGVQEGQGRGGGGLGSLLGISAGKETQQKGGPCFSGASPASCWVGWVLCPLFTL